MNMYLEKLEAGGDARSIISNMADEIEERDSILNAIFDRVAKGGEPFSLVSDIVELIPVKCLRNSNN